MRVASFGLLLSVAGGILSAPAPSEAQQAKRPYRIGVLHQSFVPNIPSVEGLKAGLKALGLEEGRDVTFDIRFSRGDPQATAAAAAALARAGVDLIFADHQEPTHAAKAATQTIPIVFRGVGDPVAAGIVSTVAQPGGNLTGVSSLSTELTPKRVEILKAIVPNLRRVWAVYHPDDSSSAAAARKAQEVAPRLKVEVVAQPVRSTEEVAQHLKGLRPGDGLLSPPALTMNIPGLLLDVHLFSKVPAVFFAAFWVRAGALVSYGSDFYAEGAQAARLVARILRGARPQDLPVEDATKIELAVNLKTARALGLTVPREVLARADHVIEWTVDRLDKACPVLREEGKDMGARTLVIRRTFVGVIALLLLAGPASALQVGERAPDFTLPGAGAKQVRLADLLGKGPVVIYTFIQAFAGLWADEISGFEANLATYEAAGAQVVGVSVDHPSTLEGFAKSNNIKHPLLSDFGRQMLPAYGALVTDEKSPIYRYGKRAYFILDRRGIVRYMKIQDNPLNLLKQEEVLKALKESGV